MPSIGAIKKIEGLHPYEKLLLAVFGTKPKPKAKPKAKPTVKKIVSASTIKLQDVPKLDDIAQGRDIGRKGNGRYIWAACPRCHKEHRLLMYSKYNGLCTNKQYSGGGYINVKLQPSDFFYPMANKDGYILEHRLVMAQHLGRCLHYWETVYHKNCNKEDNRIENLQLRHSPIFILAGKIKYLEERITLIEAENTLLRAQLNKVTESNEQATGVEPVA